MSNNFDWNDPDLAAGSGEFVKLEKVGDGVRGHITALGRKTWDDGSASPQLDITDMDGEAKVYTAGQIQAKAKLMEKRPNVGDYIEIELTQIEKRSGGKTLKHIRVDVTPGGLQKVAAANARLGNMAGGAPAAAPAGDDEPPF